MAQVIPDKTALLEHFGWVVAPEVESVKKRRERVWKRGRINWKNILEQSVSWKTIAVCYALGIVFLGLTWLVGTQ